MRKVLSLALALIMVLALTTVAFATTSDFTFNIPVYYVATNNGSTKPAVDVTVTIADCDTIGAPSFIDSSVDLTFSESDTPEDVKFAVFTVDTATISKPGTYVYVISQTSSDDLAGVVFDDNVATLTLYITQGATAEDFNVTANVKYNDEKIVGGEYDEDSGSYVKGEDTTPAYDIFTNYYQAAAQDPESGEGGFSVSKTVTGNFGDKSKEFDVTVKFSSDKALGLPIVYADSNENGSVSLVLDDGSYVGETTITLKDGETVTFNNVPYGVSFEVVEDDYSEEGYETSYSNETGTGVIDAASVSVEITNDNDKSIDTGVMLDFIPYVLVLAFVAAAVVLIVLKKRKAEEF